MFIFQFRFGLYNEIFQKYTSLRNILFKFKSENNYKRSLCARQGDVQQHAQQMLDNYVYWDVYLRVQQY